VKKDRGAALERAGEETAADFIRANSGVTHTVLIEEFSDGYATGYTGNYIKVYIRLCGACGLDALVRPGCFVQAKITEAFSDGALAELAQVSNE
jgi:threonylcarbamoyladenosine tRNA methylthiotransferase MtaB